MNSKSAAGAVHIHTVCSLSHFEQCVRPMFHSFVFHPNLAPFPPARWPGNSASNGNWTAGSTFVVYGAVESPVSDLQVVVVDSYGNTVQQVGERE